MDWLCRKSSPVGKEGANRVESEVNDERLGQWRVHEDSQSVAWQSEVPIKRSERVVTSKDIAEKCQVIKYPVLNVEGEMSEV